MKWLRATSLLFAALMTPIAVHALEESEAVSSRSEPGSLSAEESRTVSADGDVGYLPVLSDGIPMEQFSFVYEEINWNY